MRFSWRRKKHVSIKVHDLESAQFFLNTQFNSEGIYCGDNPYLAGTTVAAMIIRWYHCDEITHEVYERLLKDYQ